MGLVVAPIKKRWAGVKRKMSGVHPMPDPVTEDAKYLVVVQRGRPKLLLSQRGWLEEPGPVRVICDGQIDEGLRGSSRAPGSAGRRVMHLAQEGENAV